MRRYLKEFLQLETGILSSDSPAGPERDAQKRLKGTML